MKKKILHRSRSLARKEKLKNFDDKQQICGQDENIQWTAKVSKNMKIGLIHRFSILRHARPCIISKIKCLAVDFCKINKHPRWLAAENENISVPLIPNGLGSHEILYTRKARACPKHFMSHPFLLILEIKARNKRMSGLS